MEKTKNKIKCREYNASLSHCLECDLLLDKKCNKKFNFETPKKYIRVERNDHSTTSWNVCPTCGQAIGYRPDIKNFKCERCGQKILWK